MCRPALQRGFSYKIPALPANLQRIFEYDSMMGNKIVKIQHRFVGITDKEREAKDIKAIDHSSTPKPAAFKMLIPHDVRSDEPQQKKDGRMLYVSLHRVSTCLW